MARGLKRADPEMGTCTQIILKISLVGGRRHSEEGTQSSCCIG